MNELFGQPYDESDPTWPVKGYFDRMYNEGDFLGAIEYVLKGYGYKVNGAYCNFPDMNSPFEEEHFDGVEFSYGYLREYQGTVVVNCETFFEHVRQACDKYLERHPEDSEQVADLLSKSFF